MTRRSALRTFGTGSAVFLAAPGVLAAGHPRARGVSRAAAGAAVPTAATGTGLHGATLNLAAFPPRTSWAVALRAWQGYTGTTIRAGKVYFGPSQFPTTITRDIRAFIANGIKALLCFKPAVQFSAADMTALKNTLAMYKQAGLDADVTLWQEPENVMSAADYRAVVRNYGAAVRNYYRLAYDSGSHRAYDWVRYYPGNAQVDIVAIDYYAGNYVKGARLEHIAKLADYAKPALPFGIWEMGVKAADTGPSVSRAQVAEYFSYVQWFMATRLKAGKANAEIVWYNGDGDNTIRSSSDYRVAMWQSLVSAT